MFTTRFAHGGRTSRNGLETELVKQRVRQKNSRPNHPTTCGKVERFQDTMKRWLRARPAATTITELQTQLDTFNEIYNNHRPHRSLPHRATPATVYNTRPKAGPASHTIDTESRVRYDRISAGAVSLRINGQLHHIGLGGSEPCWHGADSGRSGCVVAAEVDRHPTVLVVEHGNELQASAERFEVLTQRRQGDLDSGDDSVVRTSPAIRSSRLDRPRFSPINSISRPLSAKW